MKTKNKQAIKTYILLLSAPVLLTIYRYHGYPEFFTEFFPSFKTHELLHYYDRIFQFVVFFILTFLIPILTVKFIFREKLSDYGLQTGNYKEGLKWLLLIPLVIAPVLYFSAQMPDIRAEYPLSKLLFERPELIFRYEVLYFVFYYIAWEFFFRGFLLFGLAGKFGNMNAILIQTISSCLVHIGKPEGEIVGSIVVGVLFGLIAIRTKSIWYVLALHAAIGILTDLFIIYAH